MKYDLIIFDCDGTLVDSEPISTKVIKSLFDDMGIKHSQEEISDLFRGTKMQSILDYIQESIGDNLPFDFEKEYRMVSNKFFREELEIFEGVDDLLESLPMHVCIASNGPHEKMDVTLPAVGLDKYFSKENIFSAYDFNSWKPEPRMFLEILKSYDVPKERALVIDDTISGLMGGVNAGIEVFAFCPKEIDPLIMEKNLSVFSSMKSIEKEIFAA